MHVKDSSGVVVKVVLALLGILYVRAYILLYSYLFVYRKVWLISACAYRSQR